MDHNQLQLLLDRLVRQRPYPGGTCPTDANLVRSVAERFTVEELERLESHLRECPECAGRLTELRAANGWFEESGDRLLGELRASFAAVPAAAMPRETRRGVDYYVQELSSAAAGVRQAVREMLLSMQSLAWGPQALPAVVAGFRGGAAAEILAPVVDEHGQGVLDAAGAPLVVRFSAVRAELGRDGHFVLDLSTEQRQYWETPSSCCKVEAALVEDQPPRQRTLRFAPQKVFANGQVIFIASLPAGIEIRQFPLSSIALQARVEGKA